MAKMGKLTPEEEARNKMVMRERDRERKRLKRMNPEYRRMEQERDRDRKKARRANEAFRQLEKLRDKIRKDRKKGIVADETALAQQFNVVPSVAAGEQKIIITDGLITTELRQNQPTQHQPTSLGTQQPTPQQQYLSEQHQLQRRRTHNANNSIAIDTNLANTTNSITTTTITGANTNINNSNNMANNLTLVTTTNMAPTTNTAAVHMSQLNKGLLYPPPNFPHHPLPIPGVTLMPSLCHPILHQNLSATLYQQNGIKQEYVDTSPTANAHNNQQSPTSALGAANNSDDHEINTAEPEIITPDVLPVPHHFNNHAHAHHLHQQQCNMFSHMTPQAHMAAAHMRAATHGSHISPSASVLAAAVAVVQSQHHHQQQQQQLHPTSQHTLTQQQQQQQQTQHQTQQ